MSGRIGRVTIAVSIALLASARVASAGLGSCCLPDGSCQDIFGSVCTAQGGVNQPGVSCNGASCGACCGISDSGPGLECNLALASNCTQGRGFAGPGTNCDNGCPFCCSCGGIGDCGSGECVDGGPNTPCFCQLGCELSVAAFEDCQGGCPVTGCCEAPPENGDPGMCANSNAAACQLLRGGTATFHPGEECHPGGRCGPKLCCRCVGPAQCGGDELCEDNCDFLICQPPCLAVISTETCAEGCEPTGCCSLGVKDPFCADMDAAACEFFDGMFVDGGSCDPVSGQCMLLTPSATPTTTPTATPSSTPTRTPTVTQTATPTNTRVPPGGMCMESSQCAPGLICIDDICTAPNVPAPATSRFGLLLGLAALIAIAAFSLRTLALRRR